MLGSDGHYGFMSSWLVCVFVLEAGDVNVHRQLGSVEALRALRSVPESRALPARPVVLAKQRYVSNQRKLLLLSNSWACGLVPLRGSANLPSKACIWCWKIELPESRTDKLLRTATWRLAFV